MLDGYFETWEIFVVEGSLDLYMIKGLTSFLAFHVVIALCQPLFCSTNIKFMNCHD